MSSSLPSVTARSALRHAPPGGLCAAVLLEFGDVHRTILRPFSTTSPAPWRTGQEPLAPCLGGYACLYIRNTRLPPAVDGVILRMREPLLSRTLLPGDRLSRMRGSRSILDAVESRDEERLREATGASIAAWDELR